MVIRQPRKLSPLASAVRIAPFTAALAGGAASAATIHVTDPAGVATSDSCTIVDAVNSINVASVQAACVIVPGSGAFDSNDTVDLAGFTDPTTITFSNVSSDSALFIERPTIIHGNLDSGGQPLVTLAPGTDVQVRLIHTGATLTIDGLAMTGGSVPSGSGGAIFMNNTVGALTLTHAVVTGNSAQIGGGIAAYESMNIRNSVISGNYAQQTGGGIACMFTCAGVYIGDSTVSQNYSAQNSGGAVYSTSNVVVTGSLISGNNTAGSGGGIFESKGFLTVSYSTIDGNRARYAGGGLFASRSATITHSTISGNNAGNVGGGVYGTSLTMDNSTVSGNTAHQYGGGISMFGNSTLISTTISGNRLVGNSGQIGAGLSLTNAFAFISGTLIFGNSGASDLGGFAQITGDHNLFGTIDPNISAPDDTLRCDPHLGPLIDNGGSTLTQALPIGSCAIDAGPATSAGSTDQRGTGFARVVGDASDIGAFESTFADGIFKNGFESE